MQVYPTVWSLWRCRNNMFYQTCCLCAPSSLQVTLELQVLGLRTQVTLEMQAKVLIQSFWPVLWWSEMCSWAEL